MVCCPCCGPKKVLSSFSFKFHSFTHSVNVSIGAYSRCNQDERGRSRIFYSSLHLAGSPAILDHVANQIIPQCKLHVFALMLMSKTSRTMITDRGPPTVADGIFSKQVISSVAHIYIYIQINRPSLGSIYIYIQYVGWMQSDMYIKSEMCVSKAQHVQMMFFQRFEWQANCRLILPVALHLVVASQCGDNFHYVCVVNNNITHHTMVMLELKHPWKFIWVFPKIMAPPNHPF